MDTAPPAKMIFVNLPIIDAHTNSGRLIALSFEDLDGHGFGPFWMDPAAVAAGPPEAINA